MRFGKRPRTGLFFGRKTTEDPPKRATPESTSYEPVGSDEWNALVAPGDADPDQSTWQMNGGGEPALSGMDESGDELSMTAETGRETTLDPTNRLLTALGRFHREVLKAREGSAHSEWPDVCMNQLIGAVEIALSQGWGEVVEALGESGRILQSYDEAARANDSVAFLEDAYEILCLMVGDLIVGTVRPGVVQKWKERYARAIEDLEADGLTLVDDEGDGESSHSEAGDPFGQNNAPAVSTPEVPFDGLPALDTLAPLEDEVSLDDDGSMDDEDGSDSEGTGSTGLLDTVSEALALIEANAGAPNPAAFATISDAVESLREEARSRDRLGAAIAGDAMLRLCEGAQQVTHSLDDRFFELAYAFPGLYAEASDLPDDDSVDSWTMECETMLVSWSAMTDEVSSDSEAPVEAVAEEPGATPEASPFDLAALDSPEQPETPVQPSSDVPDLGADIESVEFDEPASSETDEPTDYEFAHHAEPAEEDEVAVQRAIEDIINTGAEEALEAVAETFTTFDEVIDTPMQILKVAEQAVSEGRAVNAKLLLLQAAASIAESEAAEAHKALEQATQRIQEEAEAIETAMAAVAEAETQVAEAEAAVSQGAEEIEARRAEVAERSERVTEVQARIDTIDEEIRKLQERREEEVANLEQSRDELAAAESEAAQIEADIARKQEGEAETRQRLEEARAQVKHHQRRRQEFESALDRANDEVRERSESLSDLQQTMSRFGLPAKTEDNTSGDLFGEGGDE